MLSKAIKDLKAGWGLHYVWTYQAYHDISAKYKRTALGSLWIAGQMVVTSVSMALVFGALFHMPLNDALPYIMAGILIFGMLGYVFNEGTEMFMTSGGIIKNHAYPFTFYAFHTLCKNFFTFLHNVIVYFVFAAAVGVFKIPHWTILLALPLVLLFLFFWGMVAGMLASRFRDLRFMLPYLGQLLSMITPVFWRIDNMAPNVQFIMKLNPMFDLLQIVRMPLQGQSADIFFWKMAIIYTAIGGVVWIASFSAFRRRIPFWV